MTCGKFHIVWAGVTGWQFPEVSHLADVNLDMRSERLVCRYAQEMLIECERSTVKWMSVEEEKLADHLRNFFFFYLLQCLVANVMVFCGGHSRGKNNCKCFVCSVHMLFAERERECPTYLVLNQTLWTVWHFVLLESANLAGLAVWSEPGKLPATLVRIAASFVFHHWSVFRFHLLHQDSTHPWLHSNSCNVSTYDR